jgi:tripartite-type tricarboxylate transporter receptor subunit TctC
LPNRRALLVALLLLMAAPAAAWPDRPVAMVVAFSAGSSADVIGRLLADRLASRWGQPVIVHNLPGAAGTLGTDRVVRAVSDGHTIGLTGDGALVVRVSMIPPIPYDPRRDLAPISLLVRTRNVLLLHPAVPAQTLQEFVALARARPGELAYAHSGVGLSTHLGMEMLKQAADIDVTAVAYEIEGQMFGDLRAGRVQAMIATGANTLARVAAGQVRVLAVTSRDRAPSLPEVPTVAEQGFPGFEAVSWFGLVAPAGTPSAIVLRIQADAAAAMAEPALRARLDSFGVSVVGSTAEEFAALIPREIEQVAGVLASLGLRAR